MMVQDCEKWGFTAFIIFSPVFCCIYLFSPKRNPMEGIPLGFCVLGSSLVVLILVVVLLVLVVVV